MINHFKGTFMEFLIMLLTGRNLSIANGWRELELIFLSIVLLVVH